MNEIAILPLLTTTATGASPLPGEVVASNAEFFSAFSHELRTPVTAIKAFAQGLVMHWDELSPEKRYFYVERILRSSLRLEHLVTDLALAAGLAAGTVLQPVSLDIGTAVAEALDEIRALHTTRAFSVVPDPGPAMIVADKQRVQQILVSLLDTAAHQAPPRETVSIRWMTEPPMLRVEVSERGYRLSAEAEALLAEHFVPRLPLYRHPGALPDTELGLYICKTLVEAMGGALGVQSIPRAGTIFWFTLPQATA